MGKSLNIIVIFILGIFVIPFSLKYQAYFKFRKEMIDSNYCPMKSWMGFDDNGNLQGGKIPCEEAIAEYFSNAWINGKYWQSEVGTMCFVFTPIICLILAID